MELKRVVVTGIGAITPLGKTVPETWTNLVNGVSGAAPITHFDATKFKTTFACEVKNYNPTDYFDRKEARKLDPFAQFAVIAADEAIKDSKLDLDTEDKTEIGVIWGAGIGGIFTFFEEVKSFVSGDGTPRYNPFFIPKMIADIAPGYISMRYGLRGPNFGTVSACASSTNAIATALDMIRLGKANVIVSGGSEAAIVEPGVGGFTSMQALSNRNDDPQTASRPFDKDRDGFVIGEGAGVLVLEDFEHAKARNAHIYAEVAGYGATCDAYHITSPAEDGSGAGMAMIIAMKEAGIAPSQVDYINAHGTSTHHNDLFETRAMKYAFKEDIRNIAINSTKSMTGHLLGGAGAVEFIVCVKAIEDSFVHVTAGSKETEGEMDLDYNMY